MSGLIPNASQHRLEVGSAEDETCRTFVLHNEDHTLGNSLRYMLLKNCAVEYCGYSSPHPSEHKINLRVQTQQSTTAAKVLVTGIQELQQVCNHVLSTFESSVKEFKAKTPAQESDDSEEDEE